MPAKTTRLSQLLDAHHVDLLTEWLQQQKATQRKDLINDAELREQSSSFLSAVREAIRADPTLEIQSGTWKVVRELLADLSRARARQGFSPTETAMFVFSLKAPLEDRLRAELSGSADELFNETRAASTLIDRLGLYTTESFQKAREEVIAHQQAEMLELSTPVVQLWDGILALPLIGTLDSRRTQTVMETLLQRIVDTGAEIAIIDITGVPTVDTLTAQHLIKTITATRLMGADCIISGIRPQIAQTIVHLGVDLGDVLTKSSIAGALRLAMSRLGLTVVKVGKAQAGQTAQKA